MRKALLAVLIGVFLLGSGVFVFAKGRDAKKAGGRKGRAAIKTRDGGEKHKGAADAQRHAVERRQEQQRVQDKAKKDVKRRRMHLEDVNVAGRRGPGAKGKGTAEDKEKGPAFGKAHRQQLFAFERQMTHEEAKHKWRVARLNKIREIGLQEGNDAVVERAGKLLAREQKRFERKREKILARMEKTLIAGEKARQRPHQKTEQKQGESEAKEQDEAE